jgi:catechol 2,3-dioxygenase-like lactoylglutathione lyase family enzyme
MNGVVEEPMLDKPRATAEHAPLTQPPLRLHHQAFSVDDQEVTRGFMEEILGIPLVATWCERVFRPEVNREVEYCHTFYSMGDGGAIAFFQFGDAEAREKNRLTVPKVGGALHTAFKVTQQTFDELIGRLKESGTPYRSIDHGYCLSLYVNSPDGYRFEFVIDAPDAERIAAMRRADAHAELARWLAGDRTPNNDDRPH